MRFQCTPKITRRQLLSAAGLTAAYAALAGRAEAQSQPVQTKGSANCVIFINLEGAPSHIDTFDPKDGPWNPRDVDLRQHPGGIVLSRTLFPVLSNLTRHMAVLRSVASWELAHERGQFYLQTAHPDNPAFVAETPHLGAVIAKELGGKGSLPPFLALNGGTGQGAKFLGGAVEPMLAPASANGLTVIEHNHFGTASQTRFNQRFELLDQLDADMRQNAPDSRLANHSSFYGAARRMMYDQAIAAAFRFNREDDLRYGNTAFGRACIVARNAVQSRNGAAFISIRQGGWDVHQQAFDRSYPENLYDQCSELDAGLANLIQDLAASGDLAKTMIVAMGEFGRTPGDLNARGGRDHYKAAMCAFMAGGGVAGGRTIGATNADGSEIVTPGWSGDRPIYFEDIAATIYSAVGINWTRSLTDTPSGRKFELVPYADRGRFTAVNEFFA